MFEQFVGPQQADVLASEACERARTELQPSTVTAVAHAGCDIHAGDFGDRRELEDRSNRWRASARSPTAAWLWGVPGQNNGARIDIRSSKPPPSG